MPSRDDRASELRSGLFKRGILCGRRDDERGANEGLSRREIKALGEENIRPWGRKSLNEAQVAQRARDAGHR